MACGGIDLRSWLRRKLKFGCEPHFTDSQKAGRISGDDLIAAIDRYTWWHSIDLGGGVITSGVKTAELMALEFANTFSTVDLRGKSVLDIGASNGGFSVEAARRGASRVVALDQYDRKYEHWKGRETLDLVRSGTGIDIEAVAIDLDTPRLSLAQLGQFDIILFLGVFYHLMDPIAVLREIVPLARELLILETYVEETGDPRPLMIFYPGSELGGDPTNWWGPNTACVREMLRIAGFNRIDISAGSGADRKVFHAYR
jgi:tRNA (mo5U34)-methyltransferase